MSFKKIMLSPLFKFPIPWMDRFIENWNSLGDDWQHAIFTDRNIVSRGNVKVYRMNVEEFIALVEKTTECRPYCIAPSPKFGDMRPAFGLIFDYWTRGFDFWGHCDFDIVCGDVDKYASEEVLAGCDIFSTEPKIVNGIFSLYRNTPEINLLFKGWSRWREIFESDKYHAFDEVEFSKHVRNLREAGAIRFHGDFYQEHDNQASHRPEPRLVMDGRRLLNADTMSEMMLFHFRRTKEWPL